MSTRTIGSAGSVAWMPLSTLATPGETCMSSRRATWIGSRLGHRCTCCSSAATARISIAWRMGRNGGSATLRLSRRRVTCGRTFDPCRAAICGICPTARQFHLARVLRRSRESLRRVSGPVAPRFQRASVNAGDQEALKIIPSGPLSIADLGGMNTFQGGGRHSDDSVSNRSRNWRTVRMGMVPYEFRSSKWRSPLTITSAWPSSAQASTITSVGS